LPATQYLYRPANWTSTATTTNAYYPVYSNATYTWTTPTTMYQNVPIYTGNGNYQLTYDPAWQQWVNHATPTYADQVWRYWMDSYQYAPVPDTPETARQRREVSERFETERRQRSAARARARVLLDEFLTEEQKAELEHHGRFHVIGSRGRRYCIRATGQSGNVDLLSDRGEVQATLCAHPRGSLPDGDAWLMQMMEIRHDEDQFLRVANVHRGRLPALAR
jgi:hypothetical protein